MGAYSDSVPRRYSPSWQRRHGCRIMSLSEPVWSYYIGSQETEQIVELGYKPSDALSVVRLHLLNVP